MKTTSLFVELIVIGIGAAFGAVLLLTAICDPGLTIVGKINESNNLLLTAVGIAVIYPIGIIIDRLADRLMKRPSRHIREKIFAGERAEVLEGLVDIYTNNSPLVDMIEYGRSRMRICRGWLVNIPLILIGGITFLTISQKATTLHIFFFVLLALILTGGFYYAWYNLTFKGYEKIRDISRIIMAKGLHEPKK